MIYDFEFALHTTCCSSFKSLSVLKVFPEWYTTSGLTLQLPLEFAHSARVNLSFMGCDLPSSFHLRLCKFCLTSSSKRVMFHHCWSLIGRCIIFLRSVQRKVFTNFSAYLKLEFYCFTTPDKRVNVNSLPEISNHPRTWLLGFELFPWSLLKKIRSVAAKLRKTCAFS